MNIVERSINHYHKSFKFWLAFTFAVSVIMSVVLANYEQYKVMSVFVPFFILWMSFILVPNYKNWKHIEKNKKELEMLNIPNEEKLIISLKSTFRTN